MALEAIRVSGDAVCLQLYMHPKYGLNAQSTGIFDSYYITYTHIESSFAYIWIVSSIHFCCYHRVNRGKLTNREKVYFVSFCKARKMISKLHLRVSYRSGDFKKKKKIINSLLMINWINYLQRISWNEGRKPWATYHRWTKRWNADVALFFSLSLSLATSMQRIKDMRTLRPAFHTTPTLSSRFILRHDHFFLSRQEFSTMLSNDFFCNIHFVSSFIYSFQLSISLSPFISFTSVTILAS